MKVSSAEDHYFVDPALAGKPLAVRGGMTAGIESIVGSTMYFMSTGMSHSQTCKLLSSDAPMSRCTGFRRTAVVLLDYAATVGKVGSHCKRRKFYVSYPIISS